MPGAPRAERAARAFKKSEGRRLRERGILDNLGADAERVAASGIAPDDVVVLRLFGRQDGVRLLVPVLRQGVGGVRIQAPVTVQAVVTDDPEARLLRVHLLNYSSPPQTTPVSNRPYILPALMEDVPSYRAVVTASTDLQNASAFNPDTRVTWKGRQVEAFINDVHDVLLLNY